MAVSEVLASSWFKYGAIPAIATGVALLMKFNSRPDAKASDLEDWAVGFDLCQVSFFAILGDGVADAVKSISPLANNAVRERIEALPWLLFLMLIILFLVSFIVRKKGWDTPAAPKLNRFGVVFPLFFGLVYIIGAIMWMGAQRG